MDNVHWTYVKMCYERSVTRDRCPTGKLKFYQNRIRSFKVEIKLIKKSIATHNVLHIQYILIHI